MAAQTPNMFSSGNGRRMHIIDMADITAYCKFQSTDEHATIRYAVDSAGVLAIVCYRNNASRSKRPCGNINTYRLTEIGKLLDKSIEVNHGLGKQAQLLGLSRERLVHIILRNCTVFN